jgi:hypothetical protein
VLYVKVTSPNSYCCVCTSCIRLFTPTCASEKYTERDILEAVWELSHSVDTIFALTWSPATSMSITQNLSRNN